MTSFLDDLKESSSVAPYLGAYFILYGAVDLITFYGEFNISIIPFITFSEIISYFIKDIVVILAHILMLICGVLLIKYFFLNSLERNLSTSDLLNKEAELAINTLKDVDTEAPTSEDEEKIAGARKIIDRSEAFDVVLRRYRVFAKIFIALFALITVGLAILSARAYGWVGAIRIISPIVLIFAISAYVKQTRMVFIIYGFCTLLTSAYFNAIMNAQKIKAGGNYGLDFQIGNDVFKSDSANFVIGKTENFVFYYKSKEQRTIIFPAADMKRMEIPEKVMVQKY
jgi:hypothetical protein